MQVRESEKIPFHLEGNMAKKFKTNALRILDKEKISYEIKEYQYDDQHLSGSYIVDQVELEASQIFKTLVLQDKEKHYLVCCIPVLEEIDLKKLAILANTKSVTMLHQKDLLPVTGYLRGGCSPIGMKQQFPTYFDSSIKNTSKVAFSAGKRGYQMVVDPISIIKYLNAKIGDVIR